MNNSNTNCIQDIQTCEQLIEEEVHWLIKVINFFKLLNVCACMN